MSATPKNEAEFMFSSIRDAARDTGYVKGVAYCARSLLERAEQTLSPEIMAFVVSIQHEWADHVAKPRPA